MIYYVVQPGNLGEQYYCGERRFRRGVRWSYYQADAKTFFTHGEAAKTASDLIQRGYKNVLISRSDRKPAPQKNGRRLENARELTSLSVNFLQ